MSMFSQLDVASQPWREVLTESELAMIMRLNAVPVTSADVLLVKLVELLDDKDLALTTIKHMLTSKLSSL